MALKKRHFWNLFSGEIDLTSGNLFGKMVVFTIPVILTSLLQLFYTSADQIVVANWGGGMNSMNAVATNGPLINLIVTLFVGVSVGANVVVADAKGKGDQAKAERALHSAMLFSVIGGIVVGLIGFLMAHQFLVWMSASDEFIDLATVYLQYYFLGMPFLMIFNFGSAVLRAMGDSKRPLWALTGCGVLNIALNLFFVIVLKMDVAGVAIATVISEALEAFLIVVFLIHNKNGYARFHFSELRFSREETLEILQNGIPAGLQSFIFSISNVAIQAETNKFGAVSTAGNAASNTIEGYLYAVLNAFSVAVVAITAQNYGAHNKDNLRKIMRYAVISVVVLGLLLGGLLSFFGEPLLKLFITDKSVDQDVDKYNEALAIGESRLTLMCLTYFTCGIMDSYSAYIRGLHHSIAPTLITLFGACLLRLLFIFTLFDHVEFFHTNIWLYATYPISWTVTDVAYFFFARHYRKKALEKIDEAEKQSLAPASAK
jgi:putative MATE family efflux protein